MHTVSLPFRAISAFLAALLLAVLAPPPTPAAETPQNMRIGQQQRQEVAVTVYNNNYGLVREVRSADLPTGTIELEVSDVAEKIDPTSVAFKSLTDPEAVGILEQNYRYDLLSPSTLLEKFVGRKIRLTRVLERDGSEKEVVREGTLLSTHQGRVVQFDDGEIAINPPGSISVAEVPENLLSKPTLVWLLRNQHAGPQEVEISYLTNGMNWKADYVAVLNQTDTAIDVTGWVTLDNQSGATYEDAALKLVAGDVRRVKEEPEQKLAFSRAMAAGAARPQFEEKALFEYHLYTLGRRTTIAHRETKQMTLLEGRGAETEKIYAVESPPWAVQASVRGPAKRDVQVLIELKNSEENNMGMPLPAGRVRVYKDDDDGSLQLVGEDKIDHTPRDEKVRLLLGNAFDLVAERRKTDFRQIAADVHEMAYEVTLRNHKEEDVTIKVMEHVYGDWQILSKSHDFNKADVRTIVFPVKVPADGEVKLTYRVRVRH